jgi:tripartite-type tricarboxylate transporter receptor subunit TctC
MKIRSLIALCVALCISPFTAMAQADYPSRPIRLIIPFPAGGGTDIVGRLVAQKMSETLKQPVVVENVGGAASMIGAERAARAAADGYTLFLGGANTFAINPHLYQKINYKLEDFAPISMLAKVPMSLDMNKAIPATTLKEFAAYAKSRNDKLNYGTAGPGGTSHLLGVMVAAALGVEMVPVHYRGTGPALIDLMGGQTQVYFDNVASSLPQWQTGQIKILAVSSAERLPIAPDIPTFAESGYPDVVFYNQWSLLAPAGTPKPVIDKLNAAVVQALKSEDVLKYCRDNATLANPTTPEQALVELKADYEGMGRLVKATGIKLDQ